MKTKEIYLSLIEPNPYRDFELDPIREATVTAMMEAITSMDFWGGVVVRQMNDETYQLAFGHHRLEALRRLGKGKATFTVIQMNDDAMVKAMVAENALQRGGDSTAILDSVQAMIARIAYHVLSNSDAKVLDKCPELFESQAEIGRARANIMTGNGVGRDVIMKFNDTLSERAVKEALATFHDSGRMFGIIRSVKDLIESEEQAARDRAEMAREAKEREQAEREAEALRKLAETAEEAAAATEEKSDEHYDILANQIFPRTSHSQVFRETVTSDAGRRYIPMEQHVKLAAQIKAEAQEESDRYKEITGKDKVVLTSDYIKGKVRDVLLSASEADANYREKQRRITAEEEVRLAWKRMFNAMDAIATHCNIIQDGIETDKTLAYKYADDVIVREWFAHDVPAVFKRLQDVSRAVGITSNESLVGDSNDNIKRINSNV